MQLQTCILIHVINGSNPAGAFSYAKLGSSTRDLCIRFEIKVEFVILRRIKSFILNLQFETMVLGLV